MKSFASLEFTEFSAVGVLFHYEAVLGTEETCSGCGGYQVPQSRELT